MAASARTVNVCSLSFDACFVSADRYITRGDRKTHRDGMKTALRESKIKDLRSALGGQIRRNGAIKSARTTESPNRHYLITTHRSASTRGAQQLLCATKRVSSTVAGTATEPGPPTGK